MGSSWLKLEVSFQYGTHPSLILTSASALNTIKSSDVWFLLTDGEIRSDDVHRLADLAQQHDVLSATAQNLESWDEMPVFEDEAAFFTHCKGLDLQIVKAEMRTGLGKGVSLGAAWEEQHGSGVQVDLDLLPKAGVLPDEDLVGLLADEAFDTLAVAYKTRSRIAELRTFVQAQKVEQVAPKLEDLAGAAAIISKMGDAATTDVQRKILQEQLREAHAKNREQHQQVIASFAGSPQEQSIKKRNQMVDAALRTLASIEAASFSAEILSRKSNRARRAEIVDSVPAIDMAKLDLEAPSCKGFCLVCCGEDEIMSICFKEPDPDNVEDNTTDFALNFPLAAGASAKNVNLVSSQNICFQCALLGPQGTSIYKEALTAIIPAVEYDGSNKKYINDQLYLALTARPATGAAGIGQLFMAILQEILSTKPWAGAGLQDAQTSPDEQHEAVQRRKTFQWMLDQIVRNTRTREDFKETGAWVKFPQAVTWVAQDFETNGLASFAVTYPVAGFNNLLALGQSTGAFSNDQLHRLKSAKTVYSITAKFLAELQTALSGRSDEQWKQKYYELIYQDFNGPLVPKDQGTASLVTEVDTFNGRLSSCMGRTEGYSALSNDETVMRKVQLIVFWLLFRQKGHCTAQTFFARIRDSEPLAGAILDPTLSVPEAEHRNMLLSIFAEQDAELINADTAAAHFSLIPFANPFGASVLHCGAEGCNESFCTFTDVKEITPKNVNTIRLARTNHLIDAFGFRGRFEQSMTGLPERPYAGQPPTSMHTNLHISIVREWTAHTQEQRRT